MDIPVGVHAPSYLAVRVRRLCEVLTVGYNGSVGHCSGAALHQWLSPWKVEAAGQGEIGIGQLVTVDLKLVEERVRGILPDFPQVAGAYLFGSALGPCRPDSDIDLALVSHPGISARGDPLGRERLEARVVTAMGRLDGHPFDVVVLDPDDAIFSFKAISTGRLIYMRDEERVTDFIETVARRYRDAYPRYKRALRDIMDEVSQRGT